MNLGDLLSGKGVVAIRADDLDGSDSVNLPIKEAQADRLKEMAAYLGGPAPQYPVGSLLMDHPQYGRSPARDRPKERLYILLRYLDPRDEWDCQVAKENIGSSMGIPINAVFLSLGQGKTFYTMITSTKFFVPWNGED